MTAVEDDPDPGTLEDDEFVQPVHEALDKHKPDFLGMSALLTSTMPYMKVVIDTLRERGTRA